MGGKGDTPVPIKTVHHVDLDELIAKAVSNLDTPTLWQTIKDTPLRLSAPLCFGGYLLAVGGLDESDATYSTIDLYDRCWENVRMGGLQIRPRYYCTCSV